MGKIEKRENENWQKVGKVSDFRDSEVKIVDYEDKKAMLIRYEGKLYAYGSKCTHYGESLERGTLIKNVLVCPCHNAQFNIFDGSVYLPPAFDDLPVYDIKMEGEYIYIKGPNKKEIKVPENLNNETYVIIGSGAVGVSCAINLRKEGFEGRVVVITEEDSLPYDRTSLSKSYISGGLEDKYVYIKSEDFYKKLKIDFLFNHKVVELNIERKIIVCAHGAQISYNKLLIATGGIPRTPQIPGVDKIGFFLLRSLSDAQAIKKYIENKKKIVLIGSGFISLEVASFLREKGYEVHIVTTSEIPFKRVFGEAIGNFIKGQHVKRGVNFHNGEIKEIVGDNHIKGVVLEGGAKVEADAVIAGIGVVPAVDFLEETGLLEGNAVPVDEMLQSRVQDIFAAGDIALVPDYHTGETRRIEHWAEAEYQGQHVAKTMMGKVLPYREVPFFWTEQCSINIKYVGHSPNFDMIVYRGKISKEGFIAGFYEDNRLKAAVGVNRDRDITLIYEFLKADLDITPYELKNNDIDLKELYMKKLSLNG